MLAIPADLRLASEAVTKAWYAEYYRKRGADRNDLLNNPEVLFQALAFDVANIRAIRGLPISRDSAKVLDVGCGAGTSLLAFMRLGFPAANLAGVDINSERIEVGRAEFQTIDFRCESADQMSFSSNSFDIVFESTMFIQLTDTPFARGIAIEMLRVAKPGAFIILADWRYSKPKQSDYVGVSKRRICDLFDVGTRSELVLQTKGALVPPLGRFLSRYAAWAYFLVQTALPVAVGQKTTVLRKTETASFSPRPDL